MSLVLSAVDLALLERAAEEGKPLALAALGRLLVSDADDADQSLAWTAHYLAASRKDLLNLNRHVAPHLEACPICGLREYAEYSYGIGETVSKAEGERNALGHLGDEHYAWIVNCLCLACGHEGDLTFDTGDSLYT